MFIPTHLPHQQLSSITASTSLTTLNSSTTSTPVLLLQNLPAACPICSTYFSQPFTHYSIITPPPILTKTNKSSCTALTPCSPLKSSVLSLPTAVWNAPTLHHTLFSTLNCFGLLPNGYHKFKYPTQNCKSLPTHIISSGCPTTAICHILLW